MQIINSIIGFLDSGVYVDTTGVALHNTSPQQPIQENKNKQNINTTVMKINESQLRKIIKESIKKVLKESETPLFNDSIEQQIVQALSEFPYFWYVDFDENAYDLPYNWDELDQYERAKIIYNQSEYDDDDWIEYLGLE